MRVSLPPCRIIEVLTERVLEYDYTTADEMHLYLEGDHACICNILEGYDLQETSS